jgi:leader peptidase (prepilin peptidase)/N-methyltransferase
MELSIVVLFGVIIGSFLNVLIVRIPKGISVVFPSSHCIKCDTKLKWWHNIPILSWLILGGRCFFCKSKISIHYPLVELFSGLIFLLVYLKELDLTLSFINSGVFVLLLALSIIDLRYKAVPDSLNLLALTLAIFSSVTLVENFQNALLFAGGFALLRFYISYFLKREAMGEADIMIASTMGAIVGIKLGLMSIFLSAILALIAFLVVKKRDYELPFIPFLALALFIVYLFDRFFLNLFMVMYG